MNHRDYIPSPIKPPCDACGGKCCSARFGWDAINLNREEERLFPRESIKRIDANTRGYVFPKGKSESCIHFHDGKCEIYDVRPEACRNFDCVEFYVNSSFHYFFSMDEDVRDSINNLLATRIGDESK